MRKGGTVRPPPQANYLGAMRAGPAGRKRGDAQVPRAGGLWVTVAAAAAVARTRSEQTLPDEAGSRLALTKTARRQGQRPVDTTPTGVGDVQRRHPSRDDVLRF